MRKCFIILLPGDEDDAADYPDDQGETKIGDEGKREGHMFSDTVGCKNLDE